MDVITSVAGMVELLEAVYKESHRGQLWWRGQRKHWPVIASVHRVVDRGPYERGIALSFRGEAPSRYEHCPEPTALPAWLFLMQHHGLPTRLLDWSASALVGLYFAVRAGRHEDEDGEVLCLDPWSLNKVTVGHEATISSHELYEVFDAAFSARPPSAKSQVVAAITTEEANPRVVAQQGRFTIHGVPDALDERPGHESFLRRWRVPADAKPSLRRQLALVGVQEHRLFPDLDHLAGWLKRKCFCGKEPCPTDEREWR